MGYWPNTHCDSDQCWNAIGHLFWLKKKKSLTAALSTESLEPQGLLMLLCHI